MRSELGADLEFWVSSGRTEGGGQTVAGAMREMLAGLPGVTLKEAGWLDWPAFRQLVRSMHLLVQLSYTESFNMVTADGIAESVPSVVSDAIDWTPLRGRCRPTTLCRQPRLAAACCWIRWPPAPVWRPSKTTTAPA